MENINDSRMILKCNLEKVGNTPMVQLQAPELKNINLFAKMELYNPTDSVKDRAANYSCR